MLHHEPKIKHQWSEGRLAPSMLHVCITAAPLLQHPAPLPAGAPGGVPRCRLPCAHTAAGRPPEWAALPPAAPPPLQKSSLQMWPCSAAGSAGAAPGRQQLGPPAVPAAAPLLPLQLPPAAALLSAVGLTVAVLACCRSGWAGSYSTGGRPETAAAAAPLVAELRPQPTGRRTAALHRPPAHPDAAAGKRRRMSCLSLALLPPGGQLLLGAACNGRAGQASKR